MSDDHLIEMAMTVLARRMRVKDHLDCPGAVRDYLRLSLAGKE